MRMKRQADRQAREQYGKTHCMRKRLGYRMERQIDRQACENDEKLRDRLLVNRMEGHI